MGGYYGKKLSAQRNCERTRLGGRQLEKGVTRKRKTGGGGPPGSKKKGASNRAVEQGEGN